VGELTGAFYELKMVPFLLFFFSFLFFSFFFLLIVVVEVLLFKLAFDRS
jgi:hypothetical protein